MADDIENEEVDHDADSLKPHIAAYLEALDAAIKTYGMDAVEFRKIYDRFNADYSILSPILLKIREHCDYLQHVNTRKAEALTLIDAAVKQRKQ